MADTIFRLLKSIADKWLFPCFLYRPLQNSQLLFISNEASVNYRTEGHASQDTLFFVGTETDQVQVSLSQTLKVKTTRLQ